MTEYITKWPDKLLDRLEYLNKTVISGKQRKFIKQMSKMASLDIPITLKQSQYINYIYFRNDE